MSGMEQDDAELVTETLAGQRDTFKQIVERYQSLICSLAFSATGSVGESEDIAQETFVTAWKHLAQLREPSRLRPWLCGIARNLIGKALRRERNEPIHAAEPLDTAAESAIEEPLPPDHVISKEEQAILWRSLERIPEIYREPLVLFYREHKSVESVAADLDLTEDAVKQRLSRGRKLLHEQVLAFVEGALERTNPGKAFTLGVLAALPSFPTSTQAATIAASVAKTGALAKSAGLAGVFNAALGFIGMFLGTYFGYRLDRDGARSPEQRQFVSKYYRILIACILGFTVAVLSLTLIGWRLLNDRPGLYAALFVGLGAGYLVAIAALAFWMLKRLQNINQHEKRNQSTPLAPVFEYRSRLNLCGWPFIHIRLRAGLERGPVKAWIAVGDAAVGLLFAFGAIAIAPVSMGGFALGFITLGGIAIGAVPLGGFSLGLFAIGGMVVGLQAFGACVIAWTGAEGAIAIARDFAVGAVAFAEHANDAAARSFIEDSAFFKGALVAMRYVQWLNLMWLFPLVLWLLKSRKRALGIKPGVS